MLVDFVPGHFPKDAWALAQFDGHPCYEYHDPKEGEHKEWGTCVFNYRRPEVRNYLIGAASLVARVPRRWPASRRCIKYALSELRS